MPDTTYYSKAFKALAARQHGQTIQAIAREAGWTYDACVVAMSRARKGMLKPPGTAGTWAWSDAMDAVLVKYWQVENAHQLRERIQPLAPGRHLTVLAVNGRAHRLGLEKPGTKCSWHNARIGDRRNAA